MTSKHTPAPWLIEPHTYGRFDAYIVTETETVAQVFRRGDNLAIDEECEANAKLISAAPDLLAALIACDEAMEYISEYDIPLTLPQQVKDAIAKAT